MLGSGPSTLGEAISKNALAEKSFVSARFLLAPMPVVVLNHRVMSQQNIARLIGVAIILLVLIIAGGSGTFIVPPGHRGVLVTLGKVSPEFKPEGFGFKTPFITTVIPVIIRQQTAEMHSAVISKDLQEVRTKLKVLYRIPETSAVQIYQQFKGDPFISLIQPRVDEAIKEITKEHTAQEIVQDRATIKRRTLENAAQKVGNILTLVDVVVEDIALSANLEAAIERKMVQEQEANKAVFEQHKAQIDAQIAVIRARGEAESIRVRGEALAKNLELIDLEVVRKWNGRTPRVVGGGAGGAQMILPLAPPDFAVPTRTALNTEAQR
jgi:prohibitin 2